MRKILILLTLFVLGGFLISYNLFAKSTKPPENKLENIEESKESPLSTISDELKHLYRSINGAIFAQLLPTPILFDGPHSGPGIILGRDGPLFEVRWGSTKEEFIDPNECAYRYISFASIICIDRPLGGIGKKIQVVYYKGPFGETECAFLPVSDFSKKFIDRWKMYLLSQES